MRELRSGRAAARCAPRPDARGTPPLRRGREPLRPGRRPRERPRHGRRCGDRSVRAARACCPTRRVCGQTNLYHATRKAGEVRGAQRKQATPLLRTTTLPSSASRGRWRPVRWTDPKVALLVTEGIKKALCAIQAGATAISPPRPQAIRCTGLRRAPQDLPSPAQGPSPIDLPRRRAACSIIWALG
jgi:hypothetical protein